MGKTSRTTWKQFEKKVADMLSSVFGKKLFRNPLSGANNRTDLGKPRCGDVVMPPGVPLIVEAKFRSGHAVHRFYEEAQEDTEKVGFPSENVLLFTKEKGKSLVLVTVSADFLLRLLGIARDAGQLDTFLGS